MKYSCLSFVVIVAGAISSQARADLVINGGFETGDSTGWTITNPNNDGAMGVITGNGGYSGSAHSGSYYLWLGAYNGQIGTASQTIAVGAPETLRLSFWLKNMETQYGYQPNFFAAELDGQTVLSLTNTTAFEYTYYQFDIATTSANPLLKFSGNQEPGAWNLDDVSITLVPLPAAAWSGMGALASLGCFSVIRRRNLAEV